jgi:hypothetical protein
MGESETPDEHAASETETKSGDETEQTESAPPGQDGSSGKDSQPDIKYQG